MFKVRTGYGYIASLTLVLLLLNIMPVNLANMPSQDVTIESNVSSNIRANDPHGPIAIDGDANFSATATAEGWTGDGSAQNPYIIENYDITLGVTPEASINIINTRANYTIRGCNLIGPAATPSYGIYLENSTNGHFISNLVTNFANGLYIIGGSRNLVVSGNNISYNSDGIYLNNSLYFTITQNTCSGNFFDGIHIDSSDEGTISGNNCSQNSLTGIYLSNSYNGTISGNDCSQNSLTGIYISDSDNGTISGNSCSGNGDNGIQLTHFSEYNILTDNICNDNTNIGFRLQATDANIFENNTSIENDVGIWTTASGDNFIQWNIFANNTSNILSDGLPSMWDYNYWSDYTGSDANSDGIGDTPYTFGWVDNYPLMYPPFPVEWAQLITDQHIEFGSYFDYNIGINCPAPYIVKVNDSINFFTGVPTISSSTTLAVGDYPLTVNVTNIYGYFTEAVFTVRVRDTTPPITTHPDDFSYRVDDETDYQLEWTLSDLSPLTFSLLRNGTEVTYYDTPTTLIFFTTNIDDSLGPGVYNYTMVADDIWGNVATDMVLVTIMPIPFMEVMLPWIIVGTVGVVVVIVTFIVMRKRRK